VTSATYFEDVVVDQLTDTPAITVTQAHVEMYEALTREMSAGTSEIPVVLPLCMAIGLGWRVKDPAMAVQAFVALDWKVMKPLRVGDTMHTTSRIISKRPMRDGGLIVDERTIIDQRGEVVQQGRFTFLVAKRQKEASA
jgi:acyl dehydratase